MSHPPTDAYHLHAGPIRLKLQDGELRYLYVGEREILRRVYFAVRDRHWDTVTPTVLTMGVCQRARSFEAKVVAECRKDDIDYRWTAEIAGLESGRINYNIRGVANTSFASPRIGVCMLFGTDALAGQPYEVANEFGESRTGVFPVDVEPELLEPLNSFRVLHYTTPDGMDVRAGVDYIAFGMEDQRNYGDSSYKAMGAIAYAYPQVWKDAVPGLQYFAVAVSGNLPAEEPTGTPAITLGNRLPARVPRLTPSRLPVGFNTLTACNWDPSTYPATDPIVLPYSPALHLFDNDTYMENIPSVVDWARTLRAKLPDTAIRLDPITLNAPYPRLGDDPRGPAPFGQAWAARMLKYLALAEIDEAAFAFDNPLLRRLGVYQGASLLATTITHNAPPVVDVLAIETDGRRLIWLINLTDEAQAVTLEGKAYQLTAYEVVEVSDL